MNVSLEHSEWFSLVDSLISWNIYLLKDKECEFLCSWHLACIQPLVLFENDPELFNSWPKSQWLYTRDLQNILWGLLLMIQCWKVKLKTSSASMMAI